jgi:hypothetical protein
MIKVPTVLVLGAGASVPFGFPSGQRLVDIIAYYLRNTGCITTNRTFYPGMMETSFEEYINEIVKILKIKFQEEKIISFAEHLIGEESIDAFLEHQTDEFLQIGKAAIAATLLPFETKDALDFSFMIKRLESSSPDPFKSEKRNVIENNWYQVLWQALNASFEKFQDNKIHIITFNYDRSLEQYLYTQLKRRYPDKNDKEYASKICPIVHIHGSLGPLPWQLDSDESKQKAVPYEAMMKKSHGPETAHIIKDQKSKWLDIAREKITVIHESQEDTDELKQAREWILHSCKRLYFLGFGYHPTNIERLKIKSNCNVNMEVRGTAYHLSITRRQYMQELFSNIGLWRIEKNYNLPDMDIYTFLHDCVSLE